MATARVIPGQAANWTITFTYDGSTLTVTYPGLAVSPGDQVTFSNSSSSTAPIGITFVTPTLPPNVPPLSSPLFSNMTLQVGGSQQQTAPQNVNASVNYNVSVGGVTVPGGPYAIQVGTGPLYVQITNSAASPQSVAIPEDGMLAMFSTDVTYYLDWTSTGNPFPRPIPGLTTVYLATSTNNPNIAYEDTVSGAIFKYTISTTPLHAERAKSRPIELTKSGQPSVVAGGGNKVIIQNS